VAGNCLAILAGVLIYAPATHAQSLKTLHAFEVNSDGGVPATNLALYDGALVGTTTEGGSFNGGTLFKFILTSQIYSVIYNFGKPPDGGSGPCAHPNLQAGVFYGTTIAGGNITTNGGTAFGVSAATGQLVFSAVFAQSGGYVPEGGVSGAGRYLYGTTDAGDRNNGGNIFRLDTVKSKIRVAYAFVTKAGGANPTAPLLHIGKLFYGTTLRGGSAGAGTIFAWNSATGAERVVYSFKGGADGGPNPYSGLILFRGQLYGTTSVGGAHRQGTIYRVDPATGSKTILHSFAGSNGDGATPLAAPTAQGNALYGTTSQGGRYGYGTIYKVDLTTSKETVTYNFTGFADGNAPIGRLLYFNGRFYGTTSDGGAGADGTLFSWTP
jgi:uncharacterized repeat protein (TIGR03803 family)